MVDVNKVNQVDDKGKRSPSDDGRSDPPAAVGARPDTPGWELPVLLFAGFRTLIDRTHTELAAHGHPGLRPAHGFALQAIGLDGATSSEVGRRLGVSKQAAGKTVDKLTSLGYATRSADPADARRKLVRLTPHGLDALARSAEVFDGLRAEWMRTLGAARVRELESALRAVAAPESFRLDAAGWMGGV